jgi:hypothetical protein
MAQPKFEATKDLGSMGSRSRASSEGSGGSEGGKIITTHAHFASGHLER